jgi:hypothetical protein
MHETDCTLLPLLVQGLELTAIKLFCYHKVMHKSQEILIEELKQAKQQVKVGGLYYHYKNPDQAYKVVHLAVTEWNDKICVIYQAQYGEKFIFVRPLRSWLAKNKYNGHIVNKFTPIEK